MINKSRTVAHKWAAVSQSREGRYEGGTVSLTGQIAVKSKTPTCWSSLGRGSKMVLCFLRVILPAIGPNMLSRLMGGGGVIRAQHTLTPDGGGGYKGPAYSHA